MPYHFPGMPPYIEKAAADLKLERPPHRIGLQTLVRSVASRLCQVADMPQDSKETAISEAKLDLAEIQAAVNACRAAIDDVETELVAPGRPKPAKAKRVRKPSEKPGDDEPDHDEA